MGNRKKGIEGQKIEELEEIKVIAGSINERQSALSSRLAEAEELSDGLEYDTRRLTRHLIRGQVLPLSPLPRTGVRSEVLKHLAQDGVFTLEIKSLADGSASIRVDQGLWIGLPPRLAQLLKILVRRERPSPDQFPPWSSLEEVAAELSREKGRKLGRHGVTQLISRLRRRLEERGVNRYVVATCRDRGVRFLLTSGPLKAPIPSESAGSGSSSSGGR